MTHFAISTLKPKAGLNVLIEDGGLYIEDVDQQGDFISYEVECSTFDMLEWYKKEYGSTVCNDHFEGSYFQTTSRLDDDSIVEHIKDEPKLQREFALSLRDNWVVCTE
jgi:hypothetical protein